VPQRIGQTCAEARGVSRNSSRSCRVRRRNVRWTRTQTSLLHRNRKHAIVPLAPRISCRARQMVKDCAWGIETATLQSTKLADSLSGRKPAPRRLAARESRRTRPLELCRASACRAVSRSGQGTHSLQLPTKDVERIVTVSLPRASNLRRIHNPLRAAVTPRPITHWASPADATKCLNSNYGNHMV